MDIHFFSRPALILLGLGFLFFAVVYFNLIGTAESVEDQIQKSIDFENDFYGNFNETFSGIVTSYRQKNRGGRSGGPLGVIKFNVKKSTIAQYDPRDSSDVYFVILKKDKGVVVINVPRIRPEFRWDRAAEADIQVGDSLVFDGLKDEFVLYRADSVRYQISRTDISSDPEYRKDITGEIFINR